MDKAANYRKRADALSKTIGRRSRSRTCPLRIKQKALRDMANNEDWLDGKLGTAIRPERP